jgi:hypothetical protein
VKNAKRRKGEHVLRLVQNDGSQSHVVRNNPIPNWYTQLLSSGLDSNSDGSWSSAILERNNNEIQEEDEIGIFHPFLYFLWGNLI